jgi:hypothetical protein
MKDKPPHTPQIKSSSVQFSSPDCLQGQLAKPVPIADGARLFHRNALFEAWKRAGLW